MSRRWVVVSVIFAGILISYVDRGNLSLAASSMMADFGIAPAAMGLLLSAFFWTYGAFQIPAGILIDRLGVRRAYAAAFLVWPLASASISLAPGASSVLPLRLLLGMAESVGPIASLAFIRRNFAAREQGLPTAIYIAGQNLGPALGALVGAQLLFTFGWRSLFAVTGLTALCWLPFWWFLAPRDTPRSIATTATLASAGQPGGARPSAIDWRRLASSPGLWAMSAAIFLSSYYWYFLLTWVPTYLTASRGFTTPEMGRMLSVPLFVMAGLNIAAGSIADRLVARLGRVLAVRVPFASVAYMCAGAVLLLLALPSRKAVLPVLLVSVCGIGLGNANYWAAVQAIAPPASVGLAIGFLNTISQVAGVAAPLLTGFILGPEKRFTVALAIAGICPLLAAACLAAAGSRSLERTRKAMEAK